MPSLRLIRVLAAAASALALVHALAQDFPSRPIRWIVPYAAGGASDLLARTLAERLAAQLQARVVVDNRPGGGGNIGSEMAARSAPDGYTLLQFTDGNTISPGIYPALPYDPVKDFAAITLLATGPHVIVAHPSLAANDLTELIALARSKPGEIAYATAGIGSAQHLAGEMLNQQAGIELLHLPYKGGGQAIVDLVGGQVTLGIIGMAPALPHIRAGKLKAIAVTGRQRSAALPSVPAVAEQGVPGFESVQWFGVTAPSGTPPAIIDRLHREIARAMQSPEMTERLAAIGAQAVVNSPSAFAAYIDEDVRRWGAISKAMGIRAQ